MSDTAMATESEGRTSIRRGRDPTGREILWRLRVCSSGGGGGGGGGGGVGGEDRARVVEALLGGPGREVPPVLPEHEDPARNLRDDVQIVRGRYHRFSRLLRLDDRIDERPAAPGREPRW